MSKIYIAYKKFVNKNRYKFYMYLYEKYSLLFLKVIFEKFQILDIFFEIEKKMQQIQNIVKLIIF